MTTAREKFDLRLKRLQKWGDRCGRALDREMSAMEELYRESIAELEGDRLRTEQEFSQREMEITARLEAEGKNLQVEKYKTEKEKAAARTDLERSAFEESHRFFRPQAHRNSK